MLTVIVQYWVSILLGAYGATLLIGSRKFILSSISTSNINLTSVLFGYITDHYRSRRKPFILGLAALATSTTLFALAVSPVALLLARAFQGLSAAAVWVVGLAWIVDNVSQDRIGEAMGNTAMGMSMGYLLGPMVGGVACVHTSSYTYISRVISDFVSGTRNWDTTACLLCPRCSRCCRSSCSLY